MGPPPRKIYVAACNCQCGQVGKKKNVPHKGGAGAATRTGERQDDGGRRDRGKRHKQKSLEK